MTDTEQENAVNESKHESVGDVLADMRQQTRDGWTSDARLGNYADRIERAHARESAAQVGAPDGWRDALVKAEAALADIGDADREPGDDVAWCERRAAEALPTVRAVLSAAPAPAAAPDPKPVAEGDARSGIYVECRQCDACGHAGINDADHKMAACHDCEWNGPSPVEDRCPGCGREGTMTSACPKCHARYTFVADKEIVAQPSPEPPPAEPDPQPASVGEVEALAEPMRLAVAFDFADNPRPYHSLACPADTNGELYRALKTLAAHARRLAARQRETAEGDIEKIIAERDRVESVLDKVLDHLLGPDRSEWSSAYGYDDAVDDVEERMVQLTAARQPAQDTVEPLDRAMSPSGADAFAHMAGQPAQASEPVMMIHASDYGIDGKMLDIPMGIVRFLETHPVGTKLYTALAPSEDAGLKVGDRVEWRDDEGERYDGVIRGYHVNLDDGSNVESATPSRLTRLTGGSHE